MTVHPFQSGRRRLITRPLARSALATVLAIIALAAFVVVAMVALGFRDDLDVLHQVVGRIKPYLVGVHLLAIGALWLAWPWLGHHLPARWPDEARRAFLGARHRVCIGLLFIELFVVLGIPFGRM
ncbi:MAG: hypothetical protein ROZ37_15745 [Aromatoleum sp.]|jgi:uncharacterized BrkB/YihY/UPF0761 family membrane protein|uniref:hypothetical protein n=1 Tax=Aromatoleum sp. TaxID=2307007 RepID=UPI00289491E1|nr:hypothetical protein [Aromatoleum sp.]MDT3671769.1 hypothetical protein [Aromatoleum sp.]